MDSSSAPQTFSVSGFVPNPGKVFAISNLDTALSVQIYDNVSGALLGRHDGFPAACTGTCWPCVKMVNGEAQIAPYWVSWDPTANVVVIVDDEAVVTPSPNKS